MEEYAYPNDSLIATYLHGAGRDELVSMTSYPTPGNGVTSYFFQDGRGSTSQAVDGGGGLVETCKYDVHGTPTVTVAPGKTATGNRFLLTGREWYQTLGLYNFRNRFYLPSLGRFLQPDPIGFAGDPANLYRYCGNNPANWSDPSGLFRAGQFGRGLVFFVGGNVGIFGGAALSTTGLGASIGIPIGVSGVVSFGYGIENMVASFSDSPEAIVAAGSPSSLGEATGRVVAGERGRVFGGMIESTATFVFNAPKAVFDTPKNVLEFGTSGIEFGESLYDLSQLSEQRYWSSQFPILFPWRSVMLRWTMVLLLLRQGFEIPKEQPQGSRQA